MPGSGFVRTESHDDLLTLNGFRVEIDGVAITSIVTCGGLQRNVGEIEWVDGGSGITEFFSDQKITHGPITMTYRVDPTKNEFERMRSYVDATIGLGVKFDFAVIKMNHGTELFRILVYGALFKSESFSDLDNNGSGPFEVTLEIPCSYWEIVKFS